jgi:hypothetical protein
MQAITAEFFGFAEEFRCFFAEKDLKTVCFDPFLLSQAL